MPLRQFAQEAWLEIITDASKITPYPALRSRISQVWINRWTVLLLLVLIRTLMAIKDIEYGVRQAHTEAMAACTQLQVVGTTMASMPHFMAHGANQLTAYGADKAVHGLLEMLQLTVTGVEELVVFAVNVLTQTYLCLITLAITGSLHVAIDVVEDASAFLNKTLAHLGQDIEAGINDFEGALSSFMSDIDKVGSVLSGSSSAPKLDLSSQLDALNNIQLPSSLNQGLDQLNKSIPTFTQVNNFTNNAIRFPFEEVKKLIAQHVNDYDFDHTLFPVPAKQNMSYCSPNDAVGKGIGAFFDSIYATEQLARLLACIVLSILAVLVCFPMLLREVWGWRSILKRAELIRDNAVDPLDVIYIASRPLTATAGIKLASRAKSPKSRALVRWVVAYSTTFPALFVLSLGFAGFLASLFHYIVLMIVVRDIPSLEHDIGNVAGDVVGSLNNASAQWALGTNGILAETNARLNNDVFSWVNTSTSALNATLNVFVDETMHVLNETFGGTVLYSPITDVFNCLIGLKIAGIERALTWVHDHAQIDLPSLPNNTFSLNTAAKFADDPGASNFLADPNSGATDAVTAVVDRLVDKIFASLRWELTVSGMLVAMYAAIVLIAILRALYLHWFSSKSVEYGSLVDMMPHFAARGGPAHDRSSSSSSSSTAVTEFEEYNDERGDREKIGVAATTTIATPAPPPLPPPVPIPAPVPAPTSTDAQGVASRLDPFIDPPSYASTPEHERSDPFADPPAPTPSRPVQPWSTYAPSPLRSDTSAPAPAHTRIPSRDRDVDTGANFRGRQYTLHPRPMPQMQSQKSTIPLTLGSNSLSASQAYPLRRDDERVGYAGYRVVDDGLTRPGHVRKSSHPDVRWAGFGAGAAASAGAGAGAGTGTHVDEERGYAVW